MGIAEFSRAEMRRTADCLRDRIFREFSHGILSTRAE